MWTNISDYKVYCSTCFKKNQWEHFFKYKSANEYHCKCEFCGAKAFPVDSNMINPLLCLWKKGYETSFCCGGHLEKDSGYPAYPYLGLLQNLNSVPKFWREDSLNHVFYLRAPLDLKLTNHDIFMLNSSLRDWVKTVPISLYKKENTKAILKKGIKTSSNFHIFLGGHLSKVKTEFRRHFVLRKECLTNEHIKKYKKIIVKYPWQLKNINVIDLSSLESLVVMFRLNRGNSRFNVPVYSFGWGSFYNPIQNYPLFTSLLNLHPTVWTHDKLYIYKIPYAI